MSGNTPAALLALLETSENRTLSFSLCLELVFYTIPSSCITLLFQMVIANLVMHYL